MASYKLLYTKDGTPFYRIQVSRGRGESPASTRWYPPAGWSRRSIEKELHKVAARFEEDVRSGKYLTRAEQQAAEAREQERIASRVTFRDFVFQTLLPQKALGCTESTIYTYKTRLAHILPALGDRYMTDITAADLNRLLVALQTRENSLSYHTLLGIHETLSVAFRLAYQLEIITSNPMDRVPALTRSKDDPAAQTAPRVLTAEQLRAVLAAADREPLPWRAFLWLLADTGARLGELLGLQWTDIDLSAGEVSISRNVQRGPENRGLKIVAPKTLSSIRKVDIGPSTLNVLREYEQAERQRISGDLTSWVFPARNQSDMPMSPSAVGAFFRRFAKQNGFENLGLHPHMFRHTSASLAIAGGADIAGVSRRLGHSNINTTLGVYTHATDDSVHRAGDAARRMLETGAEPPSPAPSQSPEES